MNTSESSLEMNNFTLASNNTEVKSQNWSYYIDPILDIWYLYYFVKIVVKYRHRLEPSHILELSTLFRQNFLNMIQLLLFTTSSKLKQIRGM